MILRILSYRSNNLLVLGLLYYHVSVILLKSKRPGQPSAYNNPRTIGYNIRVSALYTNRIAFVLSYVPC